MLSGLGFQAFVGSGVCLLGLGPVDLGLGSLWLLVAGGVCSAGQQEEEAEAEDPNHSHIDDTIINFF